MTCEIQKDRRIRTSLYGDQKVTSEELDLLHTPSMQRLYDLKQLGFADKVFIDASHSRVSHVFGVMEIADRICAAVCGNLKKGLPKISVLEWGDNQIKVNELAIEIEDKVQAIRFAALMHDLTHAPFGHTLEDEIHLIQPNHDNPERQAEAFGKLLLEYVSWTAEETLSSNKIHQIVGRGQFRKWLIGDELLTAGNFSQVLELIAAIVRAKPSRPKRGVLSAFQFMKLLLDYNYAAYILYHLEISHKGRLEAAPKIKYPVNTLIEEACRAYIKMHPCSDVDRDNIRRLLDRLTFYPLRDAYCVDIIGNTVCADLLDYARRDSQLSGLPLSFDAERIITYFVVVSSKNDDFKEGHPFCGKAIRAAIQFSSSKFKGYVVGELMQLLQVRYYVYERMLFHPTKCVAGAMLGRLIQLLGYKCETPEYWKYIGDAVFLNELKRVSTALCTAVEQLLTPGDSLGDKPFSVDQSNAALRIIDDFDPNISTSAELALKQSCLLWPTLVEGFAGEFAPLLEYYSILHSLAKLPHSEMITYNKLAQVLSENRDRQLSLKDNPSQVSIEDMTKMVDCIDKKLSEDEREKLDKTGIKLALVKLLPRTTAIYDNYLGASSLVSRLISRRYAKRVFCLLPRRLTVKSLTLNVGEIADIFMQPRVRFQAETLIEELAQLPRGSVVIYCPPPSGPIKHANVLVTYRQEMAGPAVKTYINQTTKLRNIGDIEGPAKDMFVEHQKHIMSLENMYSSMWRLWVAVVPPSDANYDRMGNLISTVITGYVLGDCRHRKIQNDIFMVEELKEEYGDIVLSQRDVVQRFHKVGGDSSITKEEIERCMTQYLAIYPSATRKDVQSKIDSRKLISQILSVPEASRKFVAMQIPVKSGRVVVFARSGQDLINNIHSLLNMNNESENEEFQLRFRLTQEDRQEMDSALGYYDSYVLKNEIAEADGPVRIVKAIRTERIQIIYQQLLVSGLYILDEEGSRIVVNPKSHVVDKLRLITESDEENELLPSDIRFVLAHELVHHIIETKNVKYTFKRTGARRNAAIVELSCNELAGKILLPEGVIRTFLQGDVSAKSVVSICEKHGVSVSVFALRLSRHLDFENREIGIAIIVYKKEAAGWFCLKAIQNKVFHSRSNWLRDLDYRKKLPASFIKAADGCSGAETECSNVTVEDLQDVKITNVIITEHRSIWVCVIKD